MTPHEIESLADALADRVMSRLGGRTEADAWIDVHETAELLGCSVPTVERLIRSGELPSSKFGRLRRCRRSDVIGRGNTDAK
jgi:excisionase family DNA binding protein